MKRNNYLSGSIEFFIGHEILAKSNNKYSGYTFKINLSFIFYGTLILNIIFLFIHYIIIKPIVDKFRFYIITRTKNFISFSIKYSNKQITSVIGNYILKNIVVIILGDLMQYKKVININILSAIHYSN